MWNLGFRFWSTWQHVKIAGLGLLLVILVYRAQGTSVLFWLVLVATLAATAGARSVLGDLARREGVSKGKDKAGKR
ncbi:MAG: hypothetical protein M3548_22830 [Actinomycetota bacterium]|nr:hypothetical protein [Actinomycetota bacterium]